MADPQLPPAGEKDSVPVRLSELILLLPRLIKLMWRLARDPRVPPRSKAILFMLGAYLVSPIDLIPDFIPGLGHVDDLVLAAFALDQILNRVPENVVYEHWEGDENVLDVVRQIVDISAGLVPGWLRKRFGS